MSAIDRFIARTSSTAPIATPDTRLPLEDARAAAWNAHSILELCTIAARVAFIFKSFQDATRGCQLNPDPAQLHADLLAVRADMRALVAGPDVPGMPELCSRLSDAGVTTRLGQLHKDAADWWGQDVSTAVARGEFDLARELVDAQLPKGPTPEKRGRARRAERDADHRDEARKLTKEAIQDLLERRDDAVERAVLVIYARQTASEQGGGYTVEANGVGFSGADAAFGSSLAQRLQGGRRLTPGQLTAARKMMKRYWRQLVEAAAEKSAQPAGAQ